MERSKVPKRFTSSAFSGAWRRSTLSMVDPAALVKSTANLSEGLERGAKKSKSHMKQVKLAVKNARKTREISW